MQSADILAIRFRNQQLIRPTIKTPTELIRWLGAVQSQEYPGAKWSLGARLPDATDTSLDEAFNNGDILRTHVMRPTWHFVLPEDILWMTELTAPRVRTFLKPYDRKLEITDQFLSTCFKIILNALRGGNYRTRLQLSEELEKQHIEAKGQRLGHIMAHAELAGLICSGPRIGKQFTYANLTERAPNAKQLKREEALTLLARRYFQSHGPAQIKDFAWWSGLSMKDAQEARVRLPGLTSEEVQGRTYWSFSHSKTMPHAESSAFFLSIYDEYSIAYKDRTDMSEEKYIEKFISMGNALTGIMLLDGKVMGTWKKELKKDTISITLSPMRSLTTSEKELFISFADRYKTFLGISIVKVSFV